MAPRIESRPTKRAITQENEEIGDFKYITCSEIDIIC